MLYIALLLTVICNYLFSPHLQPLSIEPLCGLWPLNVGATEHVWREEMTSNQTMKNQAHKLVGNTKCDVAIRLYDTNCVIFWKHWCNGESTVSITVLHSSSLEKCPANASLLETNTFSFCLSLTNLGVSCYKPSDGVERGISLRQAGWLPMPALSGVPSLCKCCLTAGSLHRFHNLDFSSSTERSCNQTHETGTY